MPVFVPARDHRTTRREGDTDGQVIKKITSGDNKRMKKNVGNRETLQNACVDSELHSDNSYYLYYKHFIT